MSSRRDLPIDPEIFVEGASALDQWAAIKGKPYITVSSKGIVNGLSTVLNDGADFGPDTTLGATSPTQTGSPYTTTTGINEMFNYFSSQNIGGRVYFAAGQYIFNATATYTGTVPISLYGVYSNIQGGAKQFGTVLMQNRLSHLYSVKKNS